MSIEGQDGVGRVISPGVPCKDGGQGSHWHYDYGTKLDRGVFSSLATDFRLHLDVHSDDGAGAFFQGEESHASFINRRGTVKLRLNTLPAPGVTVPPGTCLAALRIFESKEFFPHAPHFGTTGSARWRVERGTGAYRGATGTGTVGFIAELGPGADNSFRFNFGSEPDSKPFEILRPNADVTFAGSRWGLLGVDYLRRIVTATLRIKNPGPGDAFDSRLLSVSTETKGVNVLGWYPRALGDLPEGDFELVDVRFQIGLVTGCQLVILGCGLDAKFDVLTPDALDRQQTHTQTVRVRAPDFPPPL